jgi:hypothetical protein
MSRGKSFRERRRGWRGTACLAARRGPRCATWHTTDGAGRLATPELLAARRVAGNSGPARPGGSQKLLAVAGRALPRPVRARGLQDGAGHPSGTWGSEPRAGGTRQGCGSRAVACPADVRGRRGKQLARPGRGAGRASCRWPAWGWALRLPGTPCSGRAEQAGGEAPGARECLFPGPFGCGCLMVRGSVIMSTVFPGSNVQEQFFRLSRSEQSFAVAIACLVTSGDSYSGVCLLWFPSCTPW